MPAPVPAPDKSVSKPPPAPRRGVRHALEERRPAWKAGLIGTVAAHAILALLVLTLPRDLLELDQVASVPGEERVFEIELSPESFAASARPLDPQRFVEINPAAPENPPDETPLFGAQNQQVAQPEPTPEGESVTPALAGEGEQGATAIVRGTASEPEMPSASELLEQAFQTRETEAEREREMLEREEAARAVNPLPGGEQLLGSADGGVGTTVTRLPPVPGAETGPEPRQGSATGRTPTGGYFSGAPTIDRVRPRERPRLAEAAVNARDTPTIKNEFGSKNIGAISYSAKWSAYGEYLQRLIDAVQAQWERLILRSSFYPTAGATVTVVFKLNPAGEVSEVVKVDGSGGELAQRLCVSAIAERAPYGEWTDDMRAVLGGEQELTFTFFYQ